MSNDQKSVSYWLDQVRAGDKGLPVERLWERYFTRLVGVARTIFGKLPRGVADEEDVALSAFNSFCQSALRGRFPKLRDRTDLWRLLVTITARKVYQLKLKSSRQKRGGAAVFEDAA